MGVHVFVHALHHLDTIRDVNARAVSCFMAEWIDVNAYPAKVEALGTHLHYCPVDARITGTLVNVQTAFSINAGIACQGTDSSTELVSTLYLQLSFHVPSSS